jgi:hypothetical protein
MTEVRQGVVRMTTGLRFDSFQICARDILVTSFLSIRNAIGRIVSEEDVNQGKQTNAALQ